MGLGFRSPEFQPVRRKFLGGAFASGMLALGRQNARAEAFGLTNEQQQIRARGIQEMRESAATADSEIARYFGDGGWHDLPLRQVDFHDSIGNAATSARIDDQDLEGILSMAHRTPVEVMHTHTTRLARDAGLSSAESVPPSPVDMIAATQLGRKAGLEVARQLNFSAVTERGMWNYGPSSPSAGFALYGALKTPVPLLKGLEDDTEGGSEVARLLERATKKSKTPLPPGLILAFEDGGVVRYAEENPGALSALGKLPSLFQGEKNRPGRQTLFGRDY